MAMACMLGSDWKASPLNLFLATTERGVKFDADEPNPLQQGHGRYRLVSRPGRGYYIIACEDLPGLS